MDASQDVNPELESFREQWRAEVRARHPTSTESPVQASTSSQNESYRATGPRAFRTAHLSAGKPRIADTDEDYVEARVFDDTDTIQTVKNGEKEKTEPVTALEHYERAVEKEAQGSLGDSLSLYRKAFRVRYCLLQILRFGKAR